MNLLRNCRTLVAQPEILKDYFHYQMSRLHHQGQAICPVLDNKFQISGLSGFSEFHSCQHFISSQELKFFQSYAFKPGNVIDVGANLGVISFLFSEYFSTKKIHAFEADPFTFQALRQNIELNTCSNIIAENVAVAGHDGEIIFNADPVYRGTNSITNVFDEHTISIPCTTLDTYVKQQSIKDISLLKVDVEGYESLVFEGAKNLFSQRKIKVVYYEVCPEITRKADLLPSDATEKLVSHGYLIYRLNSDGALTTVDISEIEQISCENLIAICP